VNQRAIDQWHHIVATGDLAALDELIGDDAVFSSPAVFTPQHGKAKTLMYLHNRITSFKVMIRPLQGLQAVIPLMGIQLSQS
jgi:hypothetical protein